VEQPKFPTPPPKVTAENSVIGPDYANAPESVANPAVPQGDVREFILYSEESKLYPGIVRVRNMQRDAAGNYIATAEGLSAPGRYERHVFVYIPKQLAQGQSAPFMVVQDGHSYINRLAPVLDNMIAAKRVPAMIIIAPDSGGSDAQGSQRGLEYDTLSDRYSNWVEQELLPAVSQKYGVSFTGDPEGRDPERDSDDQHEAHQPGQDVADGHPHAAEHQPDHVQDCPDHGPSLFQWAR